MSNACSISYDILVIGSGFAGSLTALCLHQLGFDVVVVEKESHPRFAIGESSTPIADMILRDLSDRYDLPWLKQFSRYGSWQRHHPDVTCGLKRGFSYFKHESGQNFQTDSTHKNELLVAASINKENSDTNWLRSDFDHFLVRKLEEYGITYLDQTTIEQLRKNNGWNLQAKRKGSPISIETRFFVDATGSSNFLKTFLDIESETDLFHTNTRALFSHFTGVMPWSEYLNEFGIPAQDYPYDPDFSALHHLGDEEWMWMLRFNNDLVSAGFMINQHDLRPNKFETTLEEWQYLLNKYSSLKHIFGEAKLAGDPGKVIRTGRLQRRLKKAAGRGWAALPHTAGFIDPFHSTGIAHTLCGLEKLVHILSTSFEKKELLYKNLQNYEASVFKELESIDLLVAGCYNALDEFELFNSYTMLYFIAAINYEQQRLAGNAPSHFLSVDNTEIAATIKKSFKELNNITSGKVTESEVNAYRKTIRERISTYNIAGLLNPQARNMYRHTAATIYQGQLSSFNIQKD